MDILLMMTGVIAFPTAVLILYLYLMPYYDRVREEWVFFALVLGMFMGMIAGALHLFVGPTFIFILPIFDVMFITIVLNSSKLQGKRKTVYYGCSMGIGFGVMVLIVYGYLLFVRSGSVMRDVLLFFIVSFPFALTYGGIGGYIGEGAGRGGLWKHAFRAMAMFMPFYLFIDMFSYIDPGLILVPVAGLMIYSLMIYWFIEGAVLPRGMLRR